MRAGKNDACPACGNEPTINELQDYEALCAPQQAHASAAEMTVAELKRRIDDGDAPLLIDVREPHEHEFCNIGGELIPMAEIPGRISALDQTRETVVYCRSGIRSASVVDYMRDAGFARALNLRGGILAWADEIDPSVPKY